jgi:regulator of protease activity HflC (stomatin/prohibitin superfamily)
LKHKILEIMKEEKVISPSSGYLMLLVALVSLILGIILVINLRSPFPLGFVLLFIFILTGFFVVNPNQSVVLVLFGKYVGTVKTNGFFWVNPFYSRRRISLRAHNLDSAPIKVNDLLANPIKIGVVLVYRVKDTYRAAFDVDDYMHFVEVQTDAAIRKLAGTYAYDNFDDAEEAVTLRSGGDEIDDRLENMLRDRLDFAGIEVMEARINYLAYAEEIAQAMLKRQQATAIIAARAKIVEGAVSMVEMALNKLSERKIVDLDDERKAAMVSNLLVVLVSDKDASPVVNSGSLY